MKSRISPLLGLSLSRVIRSTITLGVLLAMTVFLLSLRHAHSAATTFTVNSRDDTNDSNCDSTPDCTLREAINAANRNPGADTINIIVIGTINLTGPLPDIIDDVTLNGPGSHMLTVRRDTGGDYRIFNVTASGVVTFFGLTISNGRLSFASNVVEGGAGVNNASATVNVINCTLADNSTVFSPQPRFVGSGGAILSSGTLNVTNSTFSNNSNGGFGGGSGDGGAIANSGTATITNSILSNNSTLGAGGAIYSNGLITVDSSTISDNSAKLAGAIYNAGKLDLSQSTISNNFASTTGGIFNASGTITVTNSTLSGNSANAGGGGIFNSDIANLTSCTLSSNSASNEGGGVLNLGSMTVDSSIIALNTAPTGPNLSGTVASLGHNVVGDVSGSTFIPTTGDQIGVTAAQLKLGPLANNGGPTQTMELCMDSVAIGAGDNAVLDPPLSLTTDQRGRGFRRRTGLQVDVGAYEVRGRARLCP